MSKLSGVSRCSTYSGSVCTQAGTNIFELEGVRPGCQDFRWAPGRVTAAARARVCATAHNDHIPESDSDEPLAGYSPASHGAGPGTGPRLGLRVTPAPVTVTVPVTVRACWAAGAAGCLIMTRNYPGEHLTRRAESTYIWIIADLRCRRQTYDIVSTRCGLRCRMVKTYDVVHIRHRRS
jgi:hypothetical protein